MQAISRLVHVVSVLAVLTSSSWAEDLITPDAMEQLRSDVSSNKFDQEPLPTLWEQGPLHYPEYGLLLWPWGTNDSKQDIRIRPTAWADQSFQDAVNGESEARKKLEDLEFARRIAASAMLGYIQVDNYLDLSPGTSALLMRIRQDTQFYNEDSEALLANWARDYNSDVGDFFEFHGAAMLDWYPSSLYHLNLVGKDPLRTFLRFAAEWDRVNNDGSGQEVDTRRYTGLVTFWANAINSRHAYTHAQVIQLGAMYEDDAVYDLQNLKFIFNYEPRGQLLRGWIEKSNFGQFFGFGRHRYGGDLPFNVFNSTGDHTTDAAKEIGKIISGADPEKKLTGEMLRQLQDEVAAKFRGDSAANRVLNYAFLRPSVGLDQILTQEGEADGALSLEDLTYNMKLKTGFTFMRQHARLAYNLVLQGSLADPSENALFQEVRLDVGLAPFNSDKRQQAAIYMPVANAYLAYQHGEQAPSFQKIDRIAAGISIKF